MDVEKNKEMTDDLYSKILKIAGSDIGPMSIDDRVKHTPINNVEWTGPRGQSFVKPTDPNMIKELQKFNIEGIKYNRRGEPDFSSVSLEFVKISDMSSDRQKNFSSAIRKFLDTDFAKKNNLNTTTQFKKYLRDNGITMHESADGVTVELVPTNIHDFFRHYGGVSKNKGYENPDPDRLVETKVSYISDQLGKKIVGFEEDVDSFVKQSSDMLTSISDKIVPEEFKQINHKATQNAVRSAIFTSAISVTTNVAAMLHDEEDLKDATINVLKDTTYSAATRYAITALDKVTELDYTDAIVYCTAQCTRQVGRYINGEISEEELSKNISETVAYSVAGYIGKTIGGMVGEAIVPGIGGVVGQYIGEVITTAVCSEVISTIELDKNFNKQNVKTRSLYRRAQEEIDYSQARLEFLVKSRNDELKTVILNGFSDICKGIEINSVDLVEKGLFTIGSKYGLTQEEFEKDKVTRENLFNNCDDEIVIQ